ncbi:hypothetical protein [Rhodococcus sp. IEGM 1379]|uniref:hypothetical protein n=1 Tax=Rhodococcus sp. IEGM 1379 TaxID=3047086 RepID=UPI0024B63AC6|nr:hypothetical protein [Rhodococcus sp. IEGM 1379]MDI9917042.1 hypothetical protein [Rhodococcus sp. IEGM 1379]
MVAERSESESCRPGRAEWGAPLATDIVGGHRVGGADVLAGGVVGDRLFGLETHPSADGYRIDVCTEEQVVPGIDVLLARDHRFDCVESPLPTSILVSVSDHDDDHIAGPLRLWLRGELFADFGGDAADAVEQCGAASRT